MTNATKSPRHKVSQRLSFSLVVCGLIEFSLCDPVTGRQALREMHLKRTHVPVLPNLNRKSKIYNPLDFFLYQPLMS